MFLDTETDGIHPGRRVWEVAMIRRDYDGDSVKQIETHFFVGLDLRDSDPFGLRVGEGVQIDPKRLGALFKAAADAGYIRLVGAENAAREESKGHLIRTWKRTRKVIPAHVSEVSAA